MISFKESGHYAFKSYPDIIDEEVLKLVSKTWLGQSSSNLGNLEPSSSTERQIEPKIFRKEEEIKIDHKDDERKMYAVNFKSSKY